MAMPPQMLQAMMQQGQQGQPQPTPGGPNPMMGQMGMDPSMGGQPPQPQMPMMGGGDDYGQGQGDDDESYEKIIDYAQQDANLAKKLKKKDPELLEKIGQAIKKGYEDDEMSREGWLKKNEQWLKMAMLVREGRTYPWPRASDVKYPLLATAAMQFSARAYPSLVPSDGNVVKCKVTPVTAQPEQFLAARRVSAHMSYQVMNCMPNWEEDMDKLLMTIPISGVCFKKTYNSSADKLHHSHLVYPENFCINYHAKSIEKAYRKSEILHYTENEVRERVQNDEEFLDVDLSPPVNDSQNKKPHIVADINPPPVDKSTPHVFIACHTYWDLDGDGYEEPVIITIHRDTGKVVRIIARWDQDGVVKNAKGEIVKIHPVEYFTAFPFIPNPDGSVYGLGFGLLLGPINESVNTLVNQLVDAGTLSNLQSGFIGKGLRLKMGDTTLRPGEWKVVNATAEDLSKSIYPMPVKEPSNVLFQLLNLLITSGNQLASIAEIFVGKMPGQNTPATTTQETIQQGMAVFTAIYKRVYRSLAAEFKKLYRLNRLCPDIVEEESKIAGIPLQASDYDLDETVIIPGADPTGDSQTVKMNKIQQIGQLIQLGTINPMVFTQKMLETLEIPNPQEWISQPQPQQDPSAQTEQLKQQTEQIKQQGMQQKQQGDAQATQQKMQLAERMAALEEARAANEQRHAEQMQALKLQGEQASQKMDQIAQVIEQHFQTQQGHLDLAQSQAKHDLTLQQSAQAHQQKQQQQNAQAKKRGRPPKTRG